jgi:hypothetical protein
LNRETSGLSVAPERSDATAADAITHPAVNAVMIAVSFMHVPEKFIRRKHART